jgi:UDP-glucose 4-epimerase
MTILVTGGLGVNGAPVLRKLVELGHKPVVLDSREDLSLLEKKTVAGLELVTGDCTDQDLLRGILQRHRIQTIVHMAAIVGEAQQVPLDAFRVNAFGTAQLLSLACENGVKRFVFTSSRGVYGQQKGEYSHPLYRPIQEDHPLRPIRVYDVCKVAAEGMGRNFASIHGIEFVALRFAAIFGPGKTLRHKNYGILSQIIERGIAGDAVRIAKGGEQKDDVIYVEDAAEAIVAATVHPKPGHDVYNISHGVGVTLHDLADAVRAVNPRAQIEIGPGLAYMGEDINYGVMDNRRAASTLDYRPRLDLKSAVADYAKRLSVPLR